MEDEFELRNVFTIREKGIHERYGQLTDVIGGKSRYYREPRQFYLNNYYSRILSPLFNTNWQLLSIHNFSIMFLHIK